MFAFLCLIGASAAALAGSVGTADGTYDFTGTLGGTDSGGTGFRTFADKFHVSNIFEQALTAVNPHNVLYANNATIGGSQTVVIKAEGGSTAKRFTFKDLGLSCYAGTQTFSSLSLVLKNEAGNTIASLSQSGSNTVNTSIKQLSTMTWGSTFSSSGWDNVASVELTFALSGDDPLEINFEDITIANVSASSASTPPTVSVTVTDTALRIGETSLVTFTFSEAVSGFTNADLTIPNGTLSAVSSSDGGVVWTATFTPNSNVTDPTNVIVVNLAGVASVATSTAGTGTTDSNNYAIDTQRPTATIVVADTALRIGETSLVTFTFSEAVSGFTNADLTVANGTLSSVSSSDGGSTWTATLTPSAGITDASNLITLDNTGVADAAGNAGSGSTDSNNYAIDTQRPTATIVVADTALRIGETSLVTFTFSEAVSGFTSADLTVANGTLSSVSSSDGGITWTATLTPSASITDTSNLITLDNTGVADAAGNAGSGSTDSNNYAIDTQRPTATIVVADTVLAAGETSGVTITFSEAVTGFTNADLTVDNGTLSSVSSSDGGITWSATLTPSAGITDATNLITLDNTGVADAAGNAGSGSTDSNNYAIDTQRPTATIVVADTVLAAGETSAVTITFSEAVTGFSNADLTVANGTLSTVSSSDGGVTWTATLTPAANTSAPSNQIVLANTGVTDAAGNAGSGTTASNSYAVQTTTATTTVVVADSSLIIGETSSVTITFSEAVSGLDAGDFTVGNGSLSAPSSTDGGVTWSATLTPAANVEVASNQLSLANSGVSTVAGGNPGTGTTVSNAYAVDTRRPTASLLVADATLTTGETSAVTITFSEAVSGFDNADLTVPNGTLSAVNSGDGGVTWTATLTPAAGTTVPGNVITLATSGVNDLAGNPGAGTSTSNAYAVRTGSFTVGGQVAGLSGSGLVLRNNGADDLAVAANGNFVFATPVADAAGYLISVATQPSSPDQICTVTRGSGSIASANVADVQVDCALSSNLPSAPRNISGTPGDRQITVQWTAPQFDGGSPVTGYLAEATPQGVGAKGAANCSTTGALTCVIGGLTNGTAYALRVSASNANGSGLAGSGTAPVTPIGLPDAPTNVQVQVSGSQATVSWVPPVNTGGAPITSYTVTASPGGLSCTVSGSPPPNSCQISGLLPGVSYTFSVVARTAAGAGNGGAGGAPTGSAVPTVIPVDSPWALGLLGFLVLLLTLRQPAALPAKARRR